jgi:predicted transposase YbfD/YdcC
MSEVPSPTIVDHFASLTDPRRDQGKQHTLLDIITIALCAVISGADNWADVERYGQRKYDWLKTMLDLPNGIPSHDTFTDVFARLDPGEFQQCFLNWVAGIRRVIGGEVIDVDGKLLRRSKDGTLGRSAIDMVSAWASEASLVLGQVKTDDHSNEITAIPHLLQVLALQGCIVTIDALGCQTTIAEAIVAKEADYILSVKENQGGLYEDIQDLFAGCSEAGFVDVPHDYAKTVNKGHGRIEIRECWTITAQEYLAYLRQAQAWRNLRTLVMVRRERHQKGRTQVETGYYISSFTGNAAQHLDAIRRHWQIENRLHWVLDIAFREDDCRVRKGYGAQNFAVLRHIALNLLRREKTAKGGVKSKRLQAAWDDTYLLRILQN